MCGFRKPVWIEDDISEDDIRQEAAGDAVE
jgi:hypothetical protein